MDNNRLINILFFHIASNPNFDLDCCSKSTGQSAGIECQQSDFLIPCYGAMSSRRSANGIRFRISAIRIRKAPDSGLSAGNRGLRRAFRIQAALRLIHLLLGFIDALGYDRPGRSRCRHRESPVMIRATDSATKALCARNIASNSRPSRRIPFLKLARMSGQSPPPRSVSASQRLANMRETATSAEAA